MLGLPAASEPCRVWLRLPGRFRGPPHGSAGRSPVRSCVSAGVRLPPCAQSEVSSVPFCLPCWHAAVCRPHTLNSTSTSKSFQSTVTGELNAPYSKQFVHSKSSQYRKMKTEWKSNVYLARSRIQVSGDFVLRNRGVGGDRTWRSGDPDMRRADEGFMRLQEQDPVFDTTSHLVSLGRGRRSCRLGAFGWHCTGRTGFVESSLELFHVT